MGALYNVSRNKAKIATIAAKAGNHLLLFEYLKFDEIEQISARLSVKLKKTTC